MDRIDDLTRLAGQTGSHVQEELPDALTLDVVRSWCAREERVLRLQHGGTLPEAQERELAGMGAWESSMTDALRRWAYLKHLYRVRWDGLEARARPEGAEEAARKLLRREPVVVELAGHRVEVTGRSYSAMAEIAAHDLRIRALTAVSRDIEQFAARLRVRALDLGRTDRLQRARLRRGQRRLADLYARVATEVEMHRWGLYAHASTATGAPSRDFDADAPEWWSATTPTDDARLLHALWTAGPGRYAELGAAPRSKSDGPGLREDFGFASLFRAWEGRMKLQPAELYDRDLGQTLVAMRAAQIDLDQEAN